MIKTCQHCGAVNGEPAEICCFCDAALGYTGNAADSRRVVAPTEGNLAVQPEWRREVSSRLQSYRARRHAGNASDLQSALPFESVSAPVVEDFDSTPEFVPTSPPDQPPLRKRQRAERVEISIPKHDIYSTPAGVHLQATAHSGSRAARDTQFPVASLRERRLAALLDGALLLFSYGGMLALFWSLGGRIDFQKLDAVVTVATFGLFYAQYFALFTIFGGSTPGMMLRRLRVVGFNGNVPTSTQMVWRSFGYMVSTGACFLGFLWALWDESHLCWQDRISQTYLTPIEDFAAIESSSLPGPEARMSR